MKRPPLDTPTVVRAAIRAADEDGVDQLTMRQLGARLGVAPMALYRYVASREALLDAVVAANLDQLHRRIARRPAPLTAAAYLYRTAYDVRELAGAHPWLVRLTVLRPPPSPGLSPPLHSLACTDAVLDALGRHGFDLPSSVRTYRAFCALLLEHLLVDVAASVADGPSLPPGRAPPSTNPLVPRSRRTSRAELLASRGTLAEFDRSLHLFLIALQSHRASPPSSSERTSADPDDT